MARFEEWKLFNSNLDVIDDAFEYLVNKSAKGMRKGSTSLRAG